MTRPGLNAPRFGVLGVLVHAVQIADVVACMERWIADRVACRFIAVTGMHGVTEALHDASFKHVLNSADLVVPDGTPLVWLARRRGYPLERRVYGPELMRSFCQSTGPKYRHFFYGGAAGVAGRLAGIFHERYGVHVAGTYSPPFRVLTNRETDEIVARIEAAAPDLLWVGLSTPKQERWMYEHKSKLRVPVMAGVGAAFDIHTARVRQAPSWMRESGLEWLFRLLQEPGRLWRRYLIYGSEFAWNASLELLGLKKFP